MSTVKSFSNIDSVFLYSGDIERYLFDLNRSPNFLPILSRSLGVLFTALGDAVGVEAFSFMPNLSIELKYCPNYVA